MLRIAPLGELTYEPPIMPNNYIKPLARLVLWDASGSWVIPLQRVGEQRAVGLRTVSLQQELDDVLGCAPESVVAVEFPRDSHPNHEANAKLRLVQQLQHAYPQVIWIALVDRTEQRSEILLRERGFQHVQTQPRFIGQLSRIVAAHWSRPSQQHSSLTEQIRQRLPWSEPR